MGPDRQMDRCLDRVSAAETYRETKETLCLTYILSWLKEGPLGTLSSFTCPLSTYPQRAYESHHNAESPGLTLESQREEQPESCVTASFLLHGFLSWGSAEGTSPQSSSPSFYSQKLPCSHL